VAETRPATKTADPTETSIGVGGPPRKAVPTKSTNPGSRRKTAPTNPGENRPPQKAVATKPDKKRFIHTDSGLAKRGKEAMGIDDIGDGASKRRRTVLRDSLFRELLGKTSER
jgi:hypothetical protein